MLTPKISARGRLKQEDDHELTASRGYVVIPKTVWDAK